MYLDCCRAIETIIKATNLGRTINDQEGVTVKQVTNSSRVGYPDLTGPLLRAFTYTWEAAKVAPILTENITNLTCPNSVTAVEAFPTYVTCLYSCIIFLGIRVHATNTIVFASGSQNSMPALVQSSTT